MIHMSQLTKRLVQGLTLALLSASVLQLTGCSSPMPVRAPVEDRTGNQGVVVPTSDSLIHDLGGGPAPTGTRVSNTRFLRS